MSGCDLSKTKIAINAQILPGTGMGGIESVLIGLVNALGKLDDGNEEYVIISPWQESDWLSPYLGSNQHIVSVPEPPGQKLTPLKKVLGPLRPAARRVWRAVFPLPVTAEYLPGVPISDGFYESLECDVIHFPWQRFTICSIPMIYNPHDLQHLHYPQFFTPKTIGSREIIFPTGCRMANTVAVASGWVKEDIVRHYQISPEKIQIIPWAPPIQSYPLLSAETLTAVRQKYNIEQPFCFYPAMTWEHKNHLRLLEALALLGDRDGLYIRLVCTGNRYPRFWPKIEQKIKELNLQDQVRFLDLLPTEQLQAIYRLSQFLIVPTLFEASSLPVFEAWSQGVPVACSTVTCLPEQVDDAALLFDPFSVEAIAEALHSMATDERLRTELSEKGRRRLGNFTWERTAKAYRAVYRRAAGHPLTEEDRWLLNWDWMQNRQNQYPET